MSADPADASVASRDRILTVFGVLYVAGFAIGLVFPESPYWLGVLGERIGDPRFFYTFLTYPLVQGGVGPLLAVGALTLVPLKILSGRFAARRLYAIAAGAAVGGGLAFALTSRDAILIGAGAVAWGLSGAVAGSVSRFPRLYRRWEIGYAVAVGFVLLGTAVLGRGGADAAILTGGGMGVLAGRFTRIADRPGPPASGSAGTADPPPA